MAISCTFIYQLPQQQDSGIRAIFALQSSNAISVIHLIVIEVEKTSQMFGLTITDNGNGQAFVKGKRANSILEHVDDILPGDAILSINGEGQF